MKQTVDASQRMFLPLMEMMWSPVPIPVREHRLPLRGPASGCTAIADDAMAMPARQL
jgi:hypothetical protein